MSKNYDVLDRKTILRAKEHVDTTYIDKPKDGQEYVQLPDGRFVVDPGGRAINHFRTVNNSDNFKGYAETTLGGEKVFLHRYGGGGGNSNTMKILDQNLKELPFKKSLKQLIKEHNIPRVSNNPISDTIKHFLRTDPQFIYGKGGYDPTKPGYFYLQSPTKFDRSFKGYGISNEVDRRLKDYMRDRKALGYTSELDAVWYHPNGHKIAAFETELRDLTSKLVEPAGLFKDVGYKDKYFSSIPGFKTEALPNEYTDLIYLTAQKHGLKLIDVDDYVKKFMPKQSKRYSRKHRQLKDISLPSIFD